MNEAETCREFVIPRLLAAGWKEEKIREQVTFTDGRIVPLAGQRALRRKQKRADYLLRYQRDFTLAVDEAKDYYRHPTDGLQHVKQYAEILGLKFANTTNDRDIVEHDYLTGQTREMVGTASLDKLDKYLRAIWLECCGHLSKFTVGGWAGIDIGKVRKADAIFKTGLVLRHLYDFGTTSETDIKAVGRREGKATTKHPIALLARNRIPEFVCQECGQPAHWLCIECVYEENQSGYLCDEHMEEHPHENYDEPMPLANSPRTGMCGYEGPAEPPY